MAKTPAQIIELERQHIERSKVAFQNARDSSNADLVALNLGQVLRAYLMQGLIGWRCGISSPVTPFRDGLSFVRQGYSTWQKMNSSNAAQAIHLPLENGLFLAFLVNDDALAFDANGLGADRLLDAVLAHGLQDQWDDQSWNAGLDQLRKLKGSSLAVESYTKYQQLLRSPRSSDIESIVDEANQLFDQRKSNGFYCGGESTDGGGRDNAITVDYRLAAIMKKIGYKSDSIHTWKWE